MMAFSIWRYSAVLTIRAARLPGSISCPRYMLSTPSCRRSFHTTQLLGLVSEDELENAKQKLTTLTEDPGNDVKLKLYSLFKQVIWNCTWWRTAMGLPVALLLCLLLSTSRQQLDHVIPSVQGHLTSLVEQNGMLGMGLVILTRHVNKYAVARVPVKIMSRW